MKKGVRKIIIILAAVAVAVGGFLVYKGVSDAAEQEAASGADFSFSEISKGDISLSVTGSGNLGSLGTYDLKAESYVAIEKVLVSQGDTVTQGQAVASLDMEAMQSYADSLKQEIISVQTSIDTTNNVTTQLAIKAPVDGWIKNIVLEKDDLIEDAMEENGYVALISTEKRQVIKVSGSGLSEGDKVKVKCQSRWYTGYVVAESDGLYVSIKTIRRTVGAQAAVYDTKYNKLFTGQIELPDYAVVQSSFGTITKVWVSENKEVEKGDTIYTASQYSIDVMAMYENLAELKVQYDETVALIEAGVVKVERPGIVSSVSMAESQNYEEGTVLVSVEAIDYWVAVVLVDELDINAVTIGQKANVELDSLPNEKFEGEVIGISDMGTASGGITTYDVKIKLDNNEKFKLNMTLSSEITAEEALDAVLAPVDAIRTSGTQSYVLVEVQRTDVEKNVIRQLIQNKDYDGLETYMGEDAAALGIKILPTPSELLYAEVRAVKTGLEDAYNMQIKSGLAEGERVLVAASGSNTGSNFMIPGMGGMEGMTMPGGMGGTERQGQGGAPARNN